MSNANAKYYRSVPEPTPDTIQQSVTALKDTVEVLARQRAPVIASAVTFQDLIDLGLITAAQVPSR